jgi:hypothetical protein
LSVSIATFHICRYVRWAHADIRRYRARVLPSACFPLLEVREHVDGATHFAFLQARDLVTIYSNPEAHLQPVENMASWELVAGSRSDGRSDRGEDKCVRLAVLKSLQELVEKQGGLQKMWSQWEGSRMLDMN